MLQDLKNYLRIVYKTVDKHQSTEVSKHCWPSALTIDYTETIAPEAWNDT